MFKKFLMSFLLLFSFFAVFAAAGNVLGTSDSFKLSVNESHFNETTGFNVTIANLTNFTIGGRWVSMNATFNVSQNNVNKSFSLLINESRVVFDKNLTFLKTSWDNINLRDLVYVNVSNYSAAPARPVANKLVAKPIKKVTPKNDFLPKGSANEIEEVATPVAESKPGFFDGVINWIKGLFGAK